MPGKNLKPFIISKLHKYEPRQKGRETIPPHIKTYCRSTTEGELSWVCLTSSNLSNAAWGALQNKNTQLCVRNFEFGILFLPSKLTNNTELRLISSESPFEYKGSSINFPLPSKIPPTVYTESDKPWSWDELNDEAIKITSSQDV